MARGWTVTKDGKQVQERIDAESYKLSAAGFLFLRNDKDVVISVFAPGAWTNVATDIVSEG